MTISQEELTTALDAGPEDARAKLHTVILTAVVHAGVLWVLDAKTPEFLAKVVKDPAARQRLLSVKHLWCKFWEDLNLEEVMASVQAERARAPQRKKSP